MPIDPDDADVVLEHATNLARAISEILYGEPQRVCAVVYALLIADLATDGDDPERDVLRIAAVCGQAAAMAVEWRNAHLSTPSSKVN